MMTPEQLFDYANKYARRAESVGKGSQYPTFRQAAKRFKVTLSEVEDACEDYSGDGYMKAAVCIRAGNGIYSFKSKGDWLVEAYQ